MFSDSLKQQHESPVNTGLQQAEMEQVFGHYNYAANFYHNSRDTIHFNQYRKPSQHHQLIDKESFLLLSGTALSG